MSDEASSIDEDLGDGKGCLRDYVATGLISREKVEAANAIISYEATFEAPNNHPGTARSFTIKLSQKAYDDLGAAGVP